MIITLPDKRIMMISNVVECHFFVFKLQLHIGDQNSGANEYDFKKALDILHLAVLVTVL